MNLHANQGINESMNSLSSLLSGLVLLSLASALSCLPWASSSGASATQFFSSRSQHDAFCNLQLQSRIARASQHHSCFSARSRANAFAAFVTTGASHQIHQHSRSADNGDDSTLWTCNFLRFLTETELPLQSRALFRPPPPRVLRGPQFFTFFFSEMNSRYSPLHFLSTTLPDQGPQPWKQRHTETLLLRPQEPQYPKKHPFVPWCFHP